MKAKYLMLVSPLACLAACAGGKAEQATGAESATEVTVTHAVFGNIPQETILKATTVYPKSVIRDFYEQNVR